MKFQTYKTWLNENVKDGITVLLPGGFKPMHAAHIQLVRRYAEHPDVKEVKVLIGPGVRNGITQKESLEVADLLLKDFDNVSVEAVKYPSPILTAYKYMETAEPGTYAMAGVKKGDDYNRVLKFVKDYEPGGKYAHTLPEGVNVVELGVNTEPIYYKGRTDENEGNPISASTLRRDIINDDFNNFLTNYPGYDIDTVRKIYDTTQMVITESEKPEYDNDINESEKPWENNVGYDHFLEDIFDAFDEDIISIDEIGDLKIDDEEIYWYYEEGYTPKEVAEILSGNDNE